MAWTTSERRAAYAADITYGTNNEFGFDYLRDNMKYELGQMVQRGHSFRDRRRSRLDPDRRSPHAADHLGPRPTTSPTSITRSTRSSRSLVARRLRARRKAAHRQPDRGRQRTYGELLRELGLLTEGSLYEAANVTIVHHVNQALRAHKLFQRDKDYIVRNGEVVIIDEFTGRMMPGRRYSEGLHQALEAKEHVQVQPENVTLASITFQNYFRLYKKLAGMTGTAATEADEFAEIYNLDVVEIPTNQPVQRTTKTMRSIARTDEKLRAIVPRDRGRQCESPADAGRHHLDRKIRAARRLAAWRTAISRSILTEPQALQKLYAAARSGKPSRLFAVLNARFHEQEAYIVAEAGVPGAITIATNMAGRGTDIQLGGNVEMRVAQECAGIRRLRERDGEGSGDPRRGRRFNEQGDRRRRPLYHRHRTAREPPDRQSAARPLGPPGRSRPLEILPVVARTI